MAYHGAAGAAAALLVTDLVTAIALLVRADVSLPAGFERPLAAAVAVAAVSGSLAALAPLLLAPVIVAAGTVCSVGIGLRANRTVARTGEIQWA